MSKNVDALGLIGTEAMHSSRAELRAAEEFGGFFDNTLSMLCVAGFDGYFKRLNPAWETALGWTMEELMAKPFMDFVHPDDREATAAELEGLIAGGRTFLFENRYRCKDGSWQWLQWNANSLPEREQVYAIARDVTSKRALEQALLDSGDREKERLGRELHDGLCQNLAGIAALSTTLSKKLGAEFKSGAEAAGEIASLLNETIGHARDMARGLNPMNLETIGLAAALEGFSENVEALFNTSCGFRCNYPDIRLGSEVEAHLYRIAQEAVNNAITHGRCKRIQISLSFRDGTGWLSVRDDGVRISEKALREGGSGTQTMAYRANLIRGRLEVGRRARRGTRVICAFALPRGAAMRPSEGQTS